MSKREQPRYVVYFVRAFEFDEETPSTLVKIGCSSRMKRRLVDLQIGSPVRLGLEAIIELTETKDRRGIRFALENLEKNVHTILHPFRVRGEWFELTPAQVREFVAGRGAAMAGANARPFAINPDQAERVFTKEAAKFQRGQSWTSPDIDAH